MLRGWSAAIVVALALVLTSANAVHRFTHRPTHGLGVIVYVGVGGPLLVLALRYVIPWVARRPVNQRVDRLIGALGLAVLVLAFAGLY